MTTAEHRRPRPASPDSRRRTGYDDFRVTGEIVPGTRGLWSIEEFEVPKHDAGWAIFSGCRISPGRYTRLLRINPSDQGGHGPGRGALWMSDTPDEYGDHAHAIYQAHGRVLINGLGLGCVARAILQKEEVTHVDIVEQDGDLVALLLDAAPWMVDPRVTVHVADAFDQCRAWPVGTCWDVAWHDIWLYKCADDLAEHAKLLRSYGRRVGWQGAWAHEELRYEQRRDRGNYW